MTRSDGAKLIDVGPDWRVGMRVTVKYRTDARYGLCGTVIGASGDALQIGTDAGEVLYDHQDNWRTL